MAKRLSEYLKEIGQEIHEDAFVTDDCTTIRPITKDEALAREIWKRALGQLITVKNGVDRTEQHRIIPPDAKAQEFIFDRREGKTGTPTDDRATTLLDKITELTKDKMNKIAEDAVDDGNDNNSNS